MNGEMNTLQATTKNNTKRSCLFAARTFKTLKSFRVLLSVRNEGFIHYGIKSRVSVTFVLFFR